MNYDALIFISGNHRQQRAVQPRFFSNHGIPDGRPGRGPVPQESRKILRLYSCGTEAKRTLAFGEAPAKSPATPQAWIWPEKRTYPLRLLSHFQLQPKTRKFLF
jgi:hypothetical protein